MNKPVDQWTLADVSAWLTDIGIGKYADVFFQHEISGAILLTMNEKDLLNPPMSVPSFGVVRKFGIRLEKLKANFYAKFAVSGTTNSDETTTAAPKRKSPAKFEIAKSPSSRIAKLDLSAEKNPFLEQFDNWNPFHTDNTVDKEKFSFPYWLPNSHNDTSVSAKVESLDTSAVASPVMPICDMEAFFNGELDLYDDPSIERKKPKTKRLKQIKREIEANKRRRKLLKHHIRRSMKQQPATAQPVM